MSRPHDMLPPPSISERRFQGPFQERGLGEYKHCHLTHTSRLQARGGEQ